MAQQTHDMYFADEKAHRRWKIGFYSSRIFIYLFLTLFGLFIILPFWFMIVTSLKAPNIYTHELSHGVSLWVSEPTFHNFQVIFGIVTEDGRVIAELTAEEYRQAEINGQISSSYNFGRYFLNTFIFATVSTALTVITTVLAAFAFARLDFKGKNALFAVLIATMMVPGEMMIITNYQTIMGFGWKDTFAGLILTNFVSIFYIFYLRQTFATIPNELYLASKVDGYGEFEYLWKVMIPIALPTITTITILSVMGAWNAFIWPNLVANGTHPIFGNDMRLVSNGLMSIFSAQAQGKDTIMVAGSMVVTAPLILIFILFRRYIMRGISRSGIKG